MRANDDVVGVYWPEYNASLQGTLIVFEDQNGLKIQSEQDTMRASVFKLWAKALRVIGQIPPF